MQRRPSIAPSDSANNPSASHTRRNPQNTKNRSKQLPYLESSLHFAFAIHWKDIKELSTLELGASSLDCNPWSITFMALVPISETLLQINCSINFYIYCALNRRFCEVFIKKFTSFVQWISNSRQSRSAKTINEKRVPSNNGDNILPNTPDFFRWRVGCVIVTFIFEWI